MPILVLTAIHLSWLTMVRWMVGRIRVMIVVVMAYRCWRRRWWQIRPMAMRTPHYHCGVWMMVMTVHDDNNPLCAYG